MQLTLQSERLAICRLAATDAFPVWATSVRGFMSFTRTKDELSVVCPDSAVPADVRHEAGWRALQVAGPLDFSLTGVLASLAGPLAAAGVSLFAVSTFDTDYVLVKEVQLAAAVRALEGAGHAVTR